MRQQTITRLVNAPSDMDYVQAFQALAGVNLELRKQGPRARLLLRKAILEMDVGNFRAARSAARDALALESDLAEAHYQLGLAATLLACVKAEALPSGPGLLAKPPEKVRALLTEAEAAFAEAVRLRPEDEEAVEDLTVVTAVLETTTGESDLVALLRNG